MNTKKVSALFIVLVLFCTTAVFANTFTYTFVNSSGHPVSITIGTEIRALAVGGRTEFTFSSPQNTFTAVPLDGGSITYAKSPDGFYIEIIDR
jgi:hypothetical protein